MAGPFKTGDAAKAARDIFELETKIAHIQWTRVADRDDEKTYNKIALSQLDGITSDFDWKAYIKEVGAEKSPGLIVRQPDYFKALAPNTPRRPRSTLCTSVASRLA